MVVILATGLSSIEAKIESKDLIRCYHRSIVVEVAKELNSEAVVLSPHLNGEEDLLKEVIIPLRKNGVRIIFLPGSIDSPDTKEWVKKLIPWGVYCYVFDPVTADKVTNRLANPGKIKDLPAVITQTVGENIDLEQAVEEAFPAIPVKKSFLDILKDKIPKIKKPEQPSLEPVWTPPWEQESKQVPEPKQSELPKQTWPNSKPKEMSNKEKGKQFVPATKAPLGDIKPDVAPKPSKKIVSNSPGVNTSEPHTNIVSNTVSNEDIINPDADNKKNSVPSEEIPSRFNAGVNPTPKIIDPDISRSRGSNTRTDIMPGIESDTPIIPTREIMPDIIKPNILPCEPPNAEIPPNSPPAKQEVYEHEDPIALLRETTSREFTKKEANHHSLKLPLPPKIKPNLPRIKLSGSIAARRQNSLSQERIKRLVNHQDIKWGFKDIFSMLWVPFIVALMVGGSAYFVFKILIRS